VSLENRVFSQADSARISDKYVAVRLLGGDDLDDEGREFMRRFDIGGYPTMLALTADGAVAGRSFGDWTTDGILGAMESAEKANTEFLAKEAELTKKGDPASSRELAGEYLVRAEFEKSRSALEKLVSTGEPELEDQLMLLEVVGRLGDKDARKALLGTLIETRKDHEDHINWRVDLAMAHLPTQITNEEEFREVMEGRKAALTSLLADVKKPADQAVVRHALASAFANTGDLETATGHWNWILDNARDSRVAPDAIWYVGLQLFKGAKDPFTGNDDLEKLNKCLALLEEIVAKFPDHELAAQAQQAALPVVRKRIAAQIAKDDAAKKAAAEKEAGKDGEDG
jgi:hypothetical protein